MAGAGSDRYADNNNDAVADRNGYVKFDTDNHRHANSHSNGNYERRADGDGDHN